MVTQKVYYASNLGLQEEDNVKELLTKCGIDTEGRGSDWLVLAGGVSCYKDKLVECLKYLSKFYSHVFFVFGNKDYCLNEANYSEYISLVKEDLSGYPNVHLLHNEVVEVDGFRVAGSSAWYYLADNYSKAEWDTFSKDKSNVHPMGYKDSNAHSNKDADFLSSLKGTNLDLLITYFPPCEGDIECANLRGVFFPEDLPWIAGKDNFYNEDMFRVRSYSVFENNLHSGFCGLPYLELKQKERTS